METEVFSTGCMCTEEAAKLCTMASPAFTVSGERGQPVLTQAGATADTNSSSLLLVHCCKNSFNTFFLMSFLIFFVSLKLAPEDKLNGITACSYARQLVSSSQTQFLTAKYQSYQGCLPSPTYGSQAARCTCSPQKLQTSS